MASARALTLDFERAPSRGRLLSLALIGAGLVAALAVFGEYRTQSEEVDRWEKKLADTRRMARRALPNFAEEQVAAPEQAGELKAANQILDELALPWERMFLDVESAVTNDIALLGVQPDPKNRNVTVTGEARDLTSLLTFMSRLESTLGLRDVHLTTHEVRTADAHRPFVFSVQAQWAQEQ